VPNPALRRVARPPHHVLLREIEGSGYVAVGRRYGVSDNAIRKWVRQYEREAADADAITATDARAPAADAASRARRAARRDDERVPADGEAARTETRRPHRPRA
jgi:transposase-like protein